MTDQTNITVDGIDYRFSVSSFGGVDEIEITSINGDLVSEVSVDHNMEQISIQDLYYSDSDSRAAPYFEFDHDGDYSDLVSWVVSTVE